MSEAQQLTPDHQLLAEIEMLRQQVATLQQANSDLELALIATAEHGDFIEAQLQAEINERQLAQATLQSILETVTRDKADLEVMLKTIAEHGDTVEYELYNQAVASMRNSEEQFRAIAEATPIAIILGKFPNGQIKYANTTLGELLGIQNQALVNRCIRDFYANPNDGQKLDEIFNHQGYVRNYEMLIKRVDQSLVWVSASLNPLIFQGEETLLISLYDITERKEVEAALRQSEMRLREQAEQLELRVQQRTAELQQAEAELRGLFAAMTELILVVDSEGAVIKVASTDQALLYKSIDQQNGKTLPEILPRSQADKILMAIQQCLATQDTVSIEYSFMAQRRKVWYAANISPLSQDTVIFVARDITGRKQAESSLRKNEKQLRSQNAVLLDLAANRAISQGDLQSAVQTITEATASAIDIERVSVWLFDKTHTYVECIDLFQRCFQQHSSGIKLFVQDYPIYFRALQEQQTIAADNARTDPRTRELLESYLIPLGINSMLDIPIRPGGKTIGILCFEHVGTMRKWGVEEKTFARSIADLISLAIEAKERKRAEQALQAAEEKYRSIFENAAEGIFQISGDRHYLSANPALAQIYGYNSPSELIAAITDLSYQLYVQPRRWDELVAYMERFGELSECESEVFRQDGTKIWVSENIRVVKNSQGKILYYEGTTQDISARRRAEAELRHQQKNSERLLLNILPQPIAERLKRGEKTIADHFANVSVLFADIVNFTELCAHISPTELVERLNEIFCTFDNLAQQHKLEKIKTIGDAYMVVGGLPHPRPDSSMAIANMALDMLQAIQEFTTPAGQPFQLRIGIHTGPVVAGIIGSKKFIYDLWGDTVNVASRMESQGKPSKIQVTEATYQQLQNQYQFEQRGIISIKGRGEMVTYWLTGKKTISPIAAVPVTDDKHP